MGGLGSLFAVCREPYALCASATCFVYNGVAYCACDLERGRSISEQLEYTGASGERCDPDACAACAVPSPTANGATINVGAPTGSAGVLTLRLDGPPLPELNRCECACSTAGDGTTSCTVADDAH